MAFLTCSTFSDALEKCIQYNVIIPENHGEDMRTLLLLHGLSDDYTCWQRRTVIELIAENFGICVIMPDGARSFYSDMKYGDAYYTCIVNDVMNSARKLFHLSDKREHNLVAGLSMGGYGALKIALRNPDKFAGCVSLSGVLDIARVIRDGSWKREFTAVWGEDYEITVPGSDQDIFALVESYADSDKPKPRIYSACGDDDFLLGDNHSFRDFMADKGFDFKYEQFPGNHNWEFWNKALPKGLEFLFAK